jgi:16S rRNA U516 pseudouridylate synthase RsuA-like enzyme
MSNHCRGQLSAGLFLVIDKPACVMRIVRATVRIPYRLSVTEAAPGNRWTGGEAMPFDKRVHVSLTEDQYGRLKRLALKRDVTVSELIRKAIQQVYMADIDQDLGVRQVGRLGERRLLIAEAEEDIGISGGELLPEGEAEIDI